MAKNYGRYETEVVDYPDLNKCPDCETFFAADCCPICGKSCPEEMRAGNRKAVKPKKKKRRRGNTDRVQFVPWYFSNIFIIAMLILSPIIGLILTWQGPWRRGWKIFATLALIFPYVGGLLIALIISLVASLVGGGGELPVNLDLPKEAYVEQCQGVDVETLYREADARIDEYVTLTLTVDGIWNDESDDGEYTVYLECHATDADGREWRFLVRDWRQSDRINLAVGDRITVWGQVGGNVTIYNYTAGKLTSPCIHMLYVTLA